jgi:hypothetical protein
MFSTPRARYNDRWSARQQDGRMKAETKQN